MIYNIILFYSINLFINSTNIFSAVLTSIITYILLSLLLGSINEIVYLSYIFIILYVSAFSILFLFAFMISDSN